MIQIFTKRGCSYCMKAKELLERANVSYSITDVTDDPDTVNDLKNMPQVKQYNHKTFPFVFDGDKFIGGYTELQNMYDNGFLNSNNQEDF